MTGDPLMDKKGTYPRIDDKRQEITTIPIVSLLRKILPHFKEKHFWGIRKIVILDRDYNNGPKGYARYKPIKNTRNANIELYMTFLADLPKELYKNEAFLKYYIASILMHEVYHHKVRGQRKLRKCSDKKEESNAEQWANGAGWHLVSKIYPQEVYRKELEKAKVYLNNIKGTS